VLFPYHDLPDVYFEAESDRLGLAHVLFPYHDLPDPCVNFEAESDRLGLRHKENWFPLIMRVERSCHFSC
jgi:hypothetical protein